MCLRTTNEPYLTARDNIALHGRLDATASVIWETNGSAVPLEPEDQIELNENRVDFFRTVQQFEYLGTMRQPDMVGDLE